MLSKYLTSQSISAGLPADMDLHISLNSNSENLVSMSGNLELTDLIKLTHKCFKGTGSQRSSLEAFLKNMDLSIRIFDRRDLGRCVNDEKMRFDYESFDYVKSSSDYTAIAETKMTYARFLRGRRHYQKFCDDLIHYINKTCSNLLHLGFQIEAEPDADWDCVLNMTQDLVETMSPEVAEIRESLVKAEVLPQLETRC